MSEIKSAFEKAMERFQDVAPDKVSLKRKELVDKGKALCAQLMEKTIDNIEEALSKFDTNDQEYVRNGLGEALLKQIALPSGEIMLERIATIKKIAMTLSSTPAVVEQLIKQYHQVCEQYLSEQTKFTEQMQAQIAQIQQQTQGNPAQQQTLQTRLMQAIQEQRKELHDHFAPAIKKVRNNLRQLCGFALER